MKNKSSITIRFDEQGHLVLPEEILRQYNLIRGSEVQLELYEHGFQLSNIARRLKRIYIEPTNVCNLDCITCMRNVWDEPSGRMSIETFEKTLSGLDYFTSRPLIFFGGYGEPLAHPDLDRMIIMARDLGLKVELITNGILLDEEMAACLTESGVSRVWVSIDGATPEGYADVRLGAELPHVIQNLARLQEIRAKTRWHLPKLGIAFVAMKRNISDLPAVVELARRVGADKISVSNVLPHTEELRDEQLYSRSMQDTDRQPNRWDIDISLPRMDVDDKVLTTLARIFNRQTSINIAGMPIMLGVNYCPFLEKESLSIRWDGAVSPCLPLMHTHRSFLSENTRISQAYAFGNVRGETLEAIWNKPEYIRFRERLQQFDFSPCTFCNSCEMGESNLTDCFANDQPTCGGCLWAQGFITCP